jgi:predicted DNA-binding transcriptional regulator AlpA
MLTEAAKMKVETLLKVKEVARIFSVCTRTVWRWVSIGRMPEPYHLAPGVKRWKRSEIESVVNSLQR